MLSLVSKIILDCFLLICVELSYLSDKLISIAFSSSSSSIMLKSLPLRVDCPLLNG